MRGTQIPGHHAPPAIFASALVYTAASASYLQSQASSSSREENYKPTPNGISATSLKNSKAPGGTERLANRNVAGGQTLQSAWTLLSGLPNPSALFWTTATVAINALLLLFTIDVVYRAPYAYPSNDLSFARIGYVSATSASILVREPDTAQLPLYVSYRGVRNTLAPAIDDSWKSAGKVYFLSNETDFTCALRIPGMCSEPRPSCLNPISEL